MNDEEVDGGGCGGICGRCGQSTDFLAECVALDCDLVICAECNVAARVRGCELWPPECIHHCNFLSVHPRDSCGGGGSGGSGGSGGGGGGLLLSPHSSSSSSPISVQRP